MAIKLRSFAQKMRAYSNDIPRQLNVIKQQLAIEFATEVIPATPVRSGRARGNWQAGIGSVPTAQVVGPFGGEGGLNNGGRGDNSLGQIQRIVERAKPGQRIYIGNNVPYIERLNAGHSKQAPSQFVQAALQRARETIKTQRIRYGGSDSRYQRQVISTVK